MKSLKLFLLGFEITRKCNIKCMHCLRGESQNIDMKEDIVDAIFDNHNITEIKYLSFTGGEPTLNPKIVSYIIDKIIDNKIDIINYVHFLTNGLIYDEIIINSLYKLESYLRQREKSKNVVINYEISNDQYHNRLNSDLLNKFSKLSFINEQSLLPRERTKENTINEGRAKENNLGGSSITEPSVAPINIKINENDENITIENTIYVGANGNIHTECTFSYENFDQLFFGNIKENNLTYILKEAKKKK